MANQQLTNDEEIIRRTMNVSEADYLAARAPKLARSIPMTDPAGRRAVAAQAAGAPTSPSEAMRPLMDCIGSYYASRDPSHLRAAHGCLTRMSGQAAARHLTKAEMEICTQTGTDPARFAIAKRDRLTSGPLRMAVNTQAFAELPGERDASDWLKMAMAEIGKFLKAPDSSASLQNLIDAEGFLMNAMKVAGAAVRRAGGWE